MNYPGISVIIPVYNREKYLANAIDSVLAQNYPGVVEIIVADDGSKDQSLDIAYGYGDLVKVLPKPENCRTQGVSSTRNRALRAVTQEWVCFLDSDDIFLPERFNGMMELVQKQPQAKAIFGAVLCFDGKDFYSFTKPVGLTDDILYPMELDIGLNTLSFMFAREVFDQVGCFDESLSNGEDGDMWQRILQKFPSAYLPLYVGAYRVSHSADQLTKNSSDLINNSAITVFERSLKRQLAQCPRDNYRIFLIRKDLIMLRNQRNQRRARLEQLSLFACRLLCGWRFVRYHFKKRKIAPLGVSDELKNWIKNSFEYKDK